jgi:hypothetical protein
MLEKKESLGLWKGKEKRVDVIKSRGGFFSLLHFRSNPAHFTHCPSEIRPRFFPREWARPQENGPCLQKVGWRAKARPSSPAPAHQATDECAYLYRRMVNDLETLENPPHPPFPRRSQLIPRLGSRKTVTRMREESRSSHHFTGDLLNLMIKRCAH